MKSQSKRLKAIAKARASMRNKSIMRRLLTENGHPDPYKRGNNEIARMIIDQFGLDITSQEKVPMVIQWIKLAHPYVYAAHQPDDLKIEPNRSVAKRKVEKPVDYIAIREAFYKSWDWRTLRMQALKKHGARCQCCGATKDSIDISGNQVRIVVDHIQPLARRWDLRLDLENLQILCDECNMGKGAWDRTDWRNI